MERGELVLCAVLRSVHQQVLAQPVRLHQRVREAHTVGPHWIATAVVDVPDLDH